MQEGDKPQPDSAPLKLNPRNPQLLHSPPRLAKLQLAKVAPGQVLCQFGTVSPGVALHRVSRLGRGHQHEHLQGQSPSLMAMPARNSPFSFKLSNHEQVDAFWDQGTDTHPWETARASGNMKKFLFFLFPSTKSLLKAQGDFLHSPLLPFEA